MQRRRRLGCRQQFADLQCLLFATRVVSLQSSILPFDLLCVTNDLSLLLPQPLEPLTQILQNAVTKCGSGPLPAITALFLAEAATQLAAPEAAMHRRMGKLLAARPDLDLEVPLLIVYFHPSVWGAENNAALVIGTPES